MKANELRDIPRRAQRWHAINLDTNTEYKSWYKMVVAAGVPVQIAKTAHSRRVKAIDETVLNPEHVARMEIGGISITFAMRRVH